MANIKNELNNIKSAVFGKDVRKSIHDGIDTINKEIENTTNRQTNLENTFDQLVINAGNSNAEIVGARVKSDGTSYSKLGDRLDAIDSQLEQNIEEVERIVENVVDGHVKDTTCHVTTVEKSTLNSIATLTLGVHTDGLIYIFRNGLPVGDGIEITAQEVVVGDVIGNVDEDNNIILSGDLENGTYVFKYENADGTFTKIGEFEINEGTISLYTNLLKTLEVHLNKRYSGSSNSIANDGTGYFCIIIPLIGDGLTHTLRFANLNTPLTNSAVSTMYLLDSSLKNIGVVNGNKAFKDMTSGVTVSDNGRGAQVDFTAITGMSFIGLTVEVNETKTPITNSDIANYIITLDEEIV